MWLCLERLWYRTKTATVPLQGPPTTVYICGALNFILFGVGTMILGFVNDCLEDVVIGAMQLLLPFVGWIWSIVWGILIIARKSARQDSPV
ncbi:uncharacterized protein BXIN_1231 [Babesia sp. Xinjiang]|uniref:uncharacterized protein n=1 Tax=Babesia sp. Xinjiang TaxID=462227 RepID=UPI000A256864|nr:uncharacterized protein BXIN_1231 [Babesia sp. Xinjiang]ORM40147.1 hypothetical protein BXIN_1231 [Babesia sp. Xinjiang]